MAIQQGFAKYAKRFFSEGTNHLCGTSSSLKF
jgi:hypothetical protein